MELPPGTMIGKYKILRAEVMGACGIVYRAWDGEQKRQVVLKECFPTVFCKRAEDGSVRGADASSEEFYRASVSDMYRELKALSGVKHENLVSVTDVFVSNGTLCYTMDCLDGVSLRELMLEVADGERSVSPEQAHLWLWGILSAVSCMHEAGVQHRDINPDNIIITEQGRPMLVNFGAVVFREEAGLFTDEQFPIYASPELSRGEKPELRSDLYGLAATWYELLSGESPPLATQRLIEDKLLRLSSRELPQLATSVMRNLHLNRELRSDSAADWRQELMETPMEEGAGNIMLAPRTVLADRYKILKAGTAGSFGIAYVAWDSKMQRQVVLKECFPLELCYRTVDGKICVRDASKQAFYEKARSDMMREAHALAKLNHESIVRVYDVFMNQGSLYYTMAWVEGCSLQELMDEVAAGKRCISHAQAQHWLCSLLNALGYMHTKGVLHRDIKPANIMFDERGRPVLIDFGAAAFYIDKTLTQGQFSPAYASPEQVSEEEVGPQTDLYSLAVTWYELLSGNKPPHATARLFRDKLIPLSPSPELPQLTASVMHNLALNPGLRSESAAAWWDELMLAPQAAQQSLPPIPVMEAAPSFAPNLPSSPRKRKKSPAKLMGCLFSALVGVAFLAMCVFIAEQNEGQGGEKPVVENPPAPEPEKISPHEFMEKFCQRNSVRELYEANHKLREQIVSRQNAASAELGAFLENVKQQIANLSQVERVAYISMFAEPNLQQRCATIETELAKMQQQEREQLATLARFSESPADFCSNLSAHQRSLLPRLGELLKESFPLDAPTLPFDGCETSRRELQNLIEAM